MNSFTSPPPFSLELNYLIQCVRKNKITTDENIDLKEWIQLVGYHRLLPLAYEWINDGTNEIPPEFADIIRNRFYKFVERTNLQKTELCKIISILQPKFPVIVLKGLTTSLHFYENIYSRLSVDVDLIVRKEDVFSVDELLLANGFQHDFPDFSLMQWQKKKFLQMQHHFAYLHTQKKMQVELHWRLFNNKELLPIEFDTLYEETTNLAVNGFQVKSLNKEMLAFYILIHGSQHGWHRLGWVRDIHFLLKQTNIDWKKIHRWAEKYHSIHLVAQGIYLAEKILGSEISKETTRLFPKTKQVQSLISKALLFISKKEKKGKNSSNLTNATNMIFYRLQLKKSLRYKREEFSFVSVNDFRILRLPAPLFFFYVLLRPILWIFRYFEKKSGKKN